MTICFDYRREQWKSAGWRRCALRGGATYRELLVHGVDVVLELGEALAVPVDVDVVVLAAAVARLDHLAEPVQALVLAPARGDRGERLLRRERVDVLLVPGRGLGGRDAVDVGLVQREHGCRARGETSSVVKLWRESDGRGEAGRTVPPLGLLARGELVDWAGGTVQATLHADEVKTVDTAL